MKQLWGQGLWLWCLQEMKLGRGHHYYGGGTSQKDGSEYVELRIPARMSVESLMELWADAPESVRSSDLVTCWEKAPGESRIRRLRVKPACSSLPDGRNRSFMWRMS